MSVVEKSPDGDSDSCDLPVTVYSPESPLQRPFHLVGEILADLWRTRELMWILFARDLKAQFRQSILGYAWLIVPPLVTAATWYLLNRSGLLQINTGDQPYAQFVVVGTTVWAAFSASLTTPMTAIATGKEVFMKLNVPLETFILSAAGRAVFNLVISSTVLIALLLLMGVTPRITFLLYPCTTMAVVAMGLTLGLFLAPLSTLYTDVGNAVSAFVGLLMFTVPVIVDLPVEGETPGIMGLIVQYNPLTPAIALSRDALLTGHLDWLGPSLFWLVVCLPLALTAVIALRIAKPHIITRMGM